MAKKYKPRKGSSFSKKEAQIIGTKLDQLSNSSGGELTPNQVVEEAENKKSPLHKHFDWDDTVAAEKYRVDQARRLMGAIIEIVVVRGKEKEYRSFFNVVNKKGKHVYVTIERVAKQPNYLQQLIMESQQQMGRLSDILDMLLYQLKKK